MEDIYETEVEREVGFEESPFELSDEEICCTPRTQEWDGGGVYCGMCDGDRREYDHHDKTISLRVISDLSDNLHDQCLWYADCTDVSGSLALELNERGFLARKEHVKATTQDYEHWIVTIPEDRIPERECEEELVVDPTIMQFDGEETDTGSKVSDEYVVSPLMECKEDTEHIYTF